MADLFLLLLTAGVFFVFIHYVSLCDRVVTGDQAASTRPSSRSGPDAAAGVRRPAPSESVR